MTDELNPSDVLFGDVTIERAQREVRSGVAFVCSVCTKWWIGKEAGLGRCTADYGTCGGPMAGMSFPRYSGPIKDLSTWCFRCGKTSSWNILAFGSGNRLGACDQHIKILDELVVPGKENMPKAFISPRI